MKATRLIFVSTDLAYGGAETQLVRLALRLRGRGREITVVSMVPPQAYQAELAAAGIDVVSLGMRRGRPDPRAIWRLARELRRRQPQVVVSFMIHANVLARLSRPLAGVPVLVCSVRSDEEGGGWRTLAYRWTDRLCDLTTHVSPAGLERAVAQRLAPRARLQFMPNGVDTGRFAFDGAARERLRAEWEVGDEFTWLAVGRFEPAKDHATMLQAFAQVADRSVLVLVGEGTLKEACRALAGELGLEGRLRWLGLRRDIPACLSAADGYLMSSAWEGMPNVLLEAGAVGVPIVATSVGANPQLVQEGKTGWLAPAGEPSALAKAMGRLLDLEPPARQEMGAAARRYTERTFALERVVDRWEELFEQLLAGRGQR